MAQLLILKKDTPSSPRGSIVEVRASGTPFGGDEPLSYVLVKIPAPISLVNQYDEPLYREITYDIIAHDTAIDGYRIRMSSNNNISQTLGITRAMVESFLNKWNASVVSASTNEIIFDVLIMDTLESEGFWDIDVSNAIFTDTDYNIVTGIHVVQIDYSAMGNGPTYVERYVMQRGGVIVSHDSRILTAEFSSADLFKEFKKSVSERFEDRILKRRYYIENSVVDNIITNGGQISVPNSIALGYIKDRLDD
jgi:hypothetical protein